MKNVGFSIYIDKKKLVKLDRKLKKNHLTIWLDKKENGSMSKHFFICQNLVVFYNAVIQYIHVVSAYGFAIYLLLDYAKTLVFPKIPL